MLWVWQPRSVGSGLSGVAVSTMECQLANCSVHYHALGHGKPLITVSGAPGDHRIILSWLEPLFNARPGWQRLYFDLPGTGLSRGAAEITGSDQMLDVVCDFIDAVLPGQSFALLGLSYGGYLARGVVYRKPVLVDGLCLLVPWLSDHVDQTLPAPATFVENPALLAQLPPDEAERFAGLTVLQMPELLEWYRDVVVPARQGADWTVLDQVVANYQFTFDVAAQRFEKPVLVLTGRQDTHVGYRDGWDILQCYPRATFAVLDRAGHALGMEQGQLFHALVNEWLDRVEEERAGGGTLQS
jgi:pimeloyl-ACP methyl ester carboxylesterase